MKNLAWLSALIGLCWVAYLITGEPKAALPVVFAWVGGSWWGYLERLTEEK